MMFKEILPLIQEVAPFVAKVITHPYETILPLAVNLLSKAFDSNGKDLDKLAKKISEDPQASVKLYEVQSKMPEEIKKYVKESLRLPDEAEVNIKIKWD